MNKATHLRTQVDLSQRELLAGTATAAAVRKNDALGFHRHGSGGRLRSLDR